MMRGDIRSCWADETADDGSSTLTQRGITTKDSREGNVHIPSVRRE